jgi:hypothetical protein
MDKGSQADRRQLTRYKVNGDFYLTFWPSLDRIGRLKDVSGGGVSFEYAVLDRKDEVDEVEVNVFSARPDSFVLWGVPCKVVYDTRVEQPTLSGVETRRCGLQFQTLSNQQSNQLQVLLRQYVSNPVPAY